MKEVCPVEECPVEVFPVKVCTVIHGQSWDASEK
jgi:hypothetical protein